MKFIRDDKAVLERLTMQVDSICCFSSNPEYRAEICTAMARKHGFEIRSVGAPEELVKRTGFGIL